MLPFRDDFLKENYKGIGICGGYIPTTDGIHVALFWQSEGMEKATHFLRDNTALVTDIAHEGFKTYVFNKIIDFPSLLIPSLTAVSELITTELTNNLKLNIENVFYINGKFDLAGKFIINHEVERNINCGAFVLGLLNSYDYKLINLETWPVVTDITKRRYLEDWLDKENVVGADRDKYYQYNRELRGKHMLAAPSVNPKPAKYTDVNPISDSLVAFLKPPPLVIAPVV